tara:strand:+ start:687 stop:3524 length:2838 start_codon:yes stop_codon:yes gene_type:complete
MKIYNEIVLIWNDETNQYDTVYEDSYDHDGPILHAAEDDKINWKKKKAEVSDVKDLLDEIEDDITKAAEGMKDWSKATKNLNTGLEESIKLLSDNGNMTQRMVTMTQGLRSGTMDHIDLERQLEAIAMEQQQNMEEMIALEQEAIELKAAGMTDLAKLAEDEAQIRQDNLDTLYDEELHTRKMIPLSKELSAEAEKKANQTKIDDELLGGMIGKAKELGKALSSGWGLAAVAAAALAFIFKAINGLTDEMGDNFGAIGATSMDTYGAMAGLRAEAAGMGYESDVAYGAVKGLTESLGMSNIQAAEAAEHVMDLGKSMGITVDEAGNLTAILMTNQDLSAEEAMNFAKSAGALAESAGVAPGDVLRDMADSSEDMAKYTRGTGENMVRAAIQARKMGVSLDDLASTAGGLLDFESSLTAEMEASVMLGRDLNLQRARQLALEGDLAGMGAEILEQVGGVAEWNSMDVLQRQALADSVGMQVDQMSKLVNAAEEGGEAIGDMGDQNIEDLIPESTMGVLTGIMNKLQQLGADILGTLATSLKGLNFNTIFKSVEKFANNVIPHIKEFIEKIPDHLKTVEEKFKKWGWTLKWIAGLWVINKLGLMGMVTSGVKGLGKLIAKLLFQKKVTEQIAKSGKGGGKGPGGFLGTISKLKPSKLLAGGAAMILIASATWVLAKAMQQFSKGVSWKGVAMGIVSLLALVAAAVVLGMLMMSGVGAVAMIAGAAAMVILAGAMWVLGKAAQEFAKAGAMMAPTITKLSELDPVKLGKAALGIGALGLALGAFGGGSAIAGIGSAIGNFFGGDPLKKFAKFAAIGPGLKDAAGAMKSLGVAMDSLNTDKMNELGKAMGSLADQADDLAGSMAKLAMASALGGVVEGGKALVSGIWGGLKNMVGMGDKKTTTSTTATVSTKPPEMQVVDKLSSIHYTMQAQNTLLTRMLNEGIPVRKA